MNNMDEKMLLIYLYDIINKIELYKKIIIDEENFIKE